MEPPSSTAEAKPYHCTVCGDDFKRHEHLIRHSRRHTQEKPFKCDICQKEFARRDILSRHAIVHVPAAERAALPQKAQKRGTKRVQQACNNCAKGKCRCDGETPCSTCQSKNLDNCEYTMTTTPAKRRRADSSASTAAANVLLAVASSAHASPKGDWSMDYTGPHGDGLPMQPPNVYGFTPTFNGALGHDPFYGSKPGSRYASRAPSPSHEHNGQYENTFQAPSIFAFLFKDSARDLPAINSILPGILPTPNYPGEYPQRVYGHNGSEQPGAYSDYRSDSMNNANAAYGPNGNSNRASSPEITFSEVTIPDSFKELEKESLVEPFTDRDREQLGEYVAVSLPPTRLLNIFLQLFFARFNVSLPLIHRATFKSEQGNLALRLAMMALGSHYMESATEVRQPVAQLARRALGIETKTLAELQAHFLLDVADLYSIPSQGTLEAVEARRDVLLRSAHAMRLFDENYAYNPPDDATTEERWSYAQRSEERRRLSWALWLHDHLYKVFFGARAYIRLDQLRTSLPCHESLWEARSADEWAEQFAPDKMPLRTRTLLGTGRLEERGQEECSQYGAWCRTILAHVEARRVQESAEMGTDSPESVQRLEATLTQAAAAMNVLEDVVSADASSEPIVLDAALHLEFARMTTFVSFLIIRTYYNGDDTRVNAWATQSPVRARNTAISAAHIFKALVQRQASPFAGMIAFFATTILFCFAKYSPSNSDALQEVQLDQQKFRSPQAKQWVEKGNLVPVVHEIGVLEGSNLSRIISSWDRLGVAHWGMDTLKQRIESLAQYS